MTQLSQRVFSLHYVGLNLKKGVTEADFEAFVHQHGVNIPAYPGWRWSLLKGLRGERKDQYLMLYEAESHQAWERYIDSDGALTTNALAFWQQHLEGQRLLKQWRTFATFGELPVLFSTFNLLAENRHSSLPHGANFQRCSGQVDTQRVIGFHHLALKAGTSAAEFDDFIRNNIHRIDDYPGWKFHLLKGTGGSRSEQYVVMLIIESLASLNAFHPELDVATERSRQFVSEHQESERMYDEWRELASFSGAPQMYTDYLTLAGNENKI